MTGAILRQFLEAWHIYRNNRLKIRMLTVEKIGGTSMSAMKEVIDNIICYNSEEKAPVGRIFVVSAFSGVTDMLLENKKTGTPGVYHRIEKHQNFHGLLKHVLASLKEINRRYVPIGLDLNIANNFIEQHISSAEKYLSDLANILASGYVSRESILQAAREILASIGESHSAFNLTQVLLHKGLPVELIDLSGFGDHRSLTIDQRIKSAFKGVQLNDRICIVTGYVKGTEGIMREFDRGYSEITFSKITSILSPDEAIIHKEYHFSTADPLLVGVKNCVPVCFTNYDIAGQLADVGMEAIHPKAAKPLEAMGIPLRIKNTFDPVHPGTLITKDYVCPYKRVEVITGSDKILILDVYDPIMVGNVGSDLQIMQIFTRHKISYTFKTTSANSISIVVWEKDVNKKLVKELQQQFHSLTTEKAAIVCLLGSNIDQPGLLAKSSWILAQEGINIKSAGIALRKVNVQYIVDRANFRTAITVLNHAMGQKV